MRIAVSGLRHGHIASILKEVKHHEQVQIVGVAEREPELARKFIDAAGVQVTHRTLGELLAEVECDAVAVGDVYADRGAQVIEALEAGKHVLADKPLCTRVKEIERIRALAQKKGLTVMVAFTLRYTAAWQTVRRIIAEGAIGQVCTATFHGQHPLSYGTGRPEWYFEKGRHGGTINDIMVHGIDSVAYLTGQPVVEVLAARAWNMEPAEAPFFQDCDQALFRLANGAGAMMEASYKAPKGHPSNWTARLWGTQGDLTAMASGEITLRRAGEPAKTIEAKVENRSNVGDDFLHETGGLPGHRPELTTAESLDSTEKAVRTQWAADEKKSFVAV